MNTNKILSAGTWTYDAFYNNTMTTAFYNQIKNSLNIMSKQETLSAKIMMSDSATNSPVATKAAIIYKANIDEAPSYGALGTTWSCLLFRAPAIFPPSFNNYYGEQIYVDIVNLLNGQAATISGENNLPTFYESFNWDTDKAITDTQAYYANICMCSKEEGYEYVAVFFRNVE